MKCALHRDTVARPLTSNPTRPPQKTKSTQNWLSLNELFSSAVIRIHMHELLLRSINEKIHLTPAEETRLKEFFIPKKVRKKQYILNAGDVCQYITFVEKGLLRSFTVDDDG